eukprot:587828-Rhodomonas_salina.2
MSSISLQTDPYPHNGPYHSIVPPQQPPTPRLLQDDPYRPTGCAYALAVHFPVLSAAMLLLRTAMLLPGSVAGYCLTQRVPPYDLCLPMTYTMPYVLHHMTYALCPTPYVLCPTPYAIHPMPYALCPMTHTLCPMTYALCTMPYVYTLYPMTYALCPMPYALRPMLYALRHMPYPIPYALRPVYYVLCPMSCAYVLRPVSYVMCLCPMSYVLRPTSYVLCHALLISGYARCPVLRQCMAYAYGATRM